MTRRYHLELTEAEWWALRNEINATYLPALSTVAGFALVKKRVNDARPTTRKMILVSKDEAKAIMKAADNSMSDADFERDFMTARERAAYHAIEGQLNAIGHGES